MIEERTVPQWLRKIRVEWGLEPAQFAGLLRVPIDAIEHLLESAGGDSPSQPTIPPGFDAAAPLIAIYRRLATRYPKGEEQVKWLFTAHPDFGGAKPIDVAASSLENLYWVGYYLDSAPA